MSWLFLGYAKELYFWKFFGIIWSVTHRSQVVWEDEHVDAMNCRRYKAIIRRQEDPDSLFFTIYKHLDFSALEMSTKP